MASSNDEQQLPQQRDEASNESVLHKTKTIQFFGRSTPIILQNDNGPCPLLAICNILLLRNQLNLSSDISEVSQEKLLSLVAERLIDSNSNNNNKDAGYVENQQQNIADAIDLLPRLTTGIDVNIKFRRIDDFEFTPECAIFDLLDIPLYHGWLVDPQDHETASAIDSKSYNTLMGDLVSLETLKMEKEGKDKSDDDCIDFAAATTATFGVPSPCLSRAKSFEESPRSSSDQQTIKNGDTVEEAELLTTLKLSEKVFPSNKEATSSVDVLMSSDENVQLLNATPVNSVHVSEEHSSSGVFDVEPSVSVSNKFHVDLDREIPLLGEKAASRSLIDNSEKQVDQLISGQPTEALSSNDLVIGSADAPIVDEVASSTPVKDELFDQNKSMCTPVNDFDEGLHKQNVEGSSGLIVGNADSESSSGRVTSIEAVESFTSSLDGGKIPSIEAVESFTSSLDGSEPLYEGEECILDSGKIVCEDREPVYEGEMVLAEQADRGTNDACDGSGKEEISLRQGELIETFLKSTANQLTFYGLFCLQEGLKERELCVFFRNNHFSTMFKLEGELYLLATDQGYMNQPDLVWEKLNEVNGDTLFMTSTFKEFRLESSSNSTWDQQNAVSSTADYLASIDSSVTDSSNMNSDLQLAIALQQQEFEQQQQRNPPQQASGLGTSRLITGPQIPRTSGRPSSSTPRQEQKTKDKSNCKIM